MEVQVAGVLESLSALVTQSGLLNANLLGMFGLGPMEIGIVCVVMVILFGHRLPSAMRGIGSAMRGFREEVEVQRSVPEVKEVA